MKRKLVMIGLLLAVSVCPRESTSVSASNFGPRAGVVTHIASRIPKDVPEKISEPKVNVSKPEENIQESEQKVQEKDIPSAVRSPEDTWIPEDEVLLCEEIGAQYGLSPELLEAVIETESAGRQYATNGPCIGLMQVNYKIHAERAARLGCSDLYNKRDNIVTGTDLLHELIEKNGVERGLMAYNGVPDAKTRTTLTVYVVRILNRQQQLERVHGK